MSTYTEANQTRMAVKMKLSNYSWYNWSAVIADKNSYFILVHVKKINMTVKKTVPPVINGVSIKIESEER